MGPLHGIKVIEFEAIGPGPFCGMMLADMGADVIVIDRAGQADLGLNRERWYDVMMRGRRSVTLDMKSRDGAQAALELIGKADALAIPLGESPYDLPLDMAQIAELERILDLLGNAT